MRNTVKRQPDRGKSTAIEKTRNLLPIEGRALQCVKGSFRFPRIGPVWIAYTIIQRIGNVASFVPHFYVKCPLVVGIGFCRNIDIHCRVFYGLSVQRRAVNHVHRPCIVTSVANIYTRTRNGRPIAYYPRYVSVKHVDIGRKRRIRHKVFLSIHVDTCQTNRQSKQQHEQQE